MYIEPCCIQHQLPKLLQKEVAHFQSNSDWTACELLDVLTSVDSNIDLTVVMPSVNVALLRMLSWLMGQENRIAHLTLVTHGNQRSEVIAQLQPYASRVTMVEDAVCFSTISLKSTKWSIVVQGSINLEKSRSMQAFTLTTTEELYNQSMETLLPRIRVGKRTITL